MAGYIGKSQAVVVADNYNKTESETRYVNTDGDAFTGNLTFADNSKAIFGAGSDLKIWHDGSNSYIQEYGTGNLILGAGNTFEVRSSDNVTTGAVFNAYGSVDLNYNGSTKLATTSTGIDVTGTVTADGLTVDTAIPKITLKDTTSPKVGGVYGTIEWYTNDSSCPTNVPAKIEAVDTATYGDRGALKFYTNDSYTGAILRQQIDHNGDISFYEDTGTTPKFFWDASAERLGIGTDSPDALLDVENSTAPKVRVGDGVRHVELRGGSTTQNPAIGTYYAGALTFATNSTERMRIDSSGNLLVGTASSLGGSSSLQVVNNTGDSTQIRIRDSSAASGRHWRYGADSNNTVYIINQNSTGVYMGNDSTSWSGLSDERSKDIIEPITGAAEKVATLRAVIGKYKTDGEETRRSFLIAQDVQAVLPEAVSVANQETGYLGLSYTDVIPLLTAAIQEQQAIIESLKARLNAANL